MISPLGPVSMKRGVWKPVAYSSISNPCGTCNCAPSGRATTLGPLSADGVAKGAGNFASCCCTCAERLRADARIAAARECVYFGIAFNFSVQEGVGYNLAHGHQNPDRFSFDDDRAMGAAGQDRVGLAQQERGRQESRKAQA